ncbi:MAG: hypothetical protein HXX16_20240 [Bacteroidales bacterium]|nr:hypothetical protein [Bacteroidales bacterium]
MKKVLIYLLLSFSVICFGQNSNWKNRYTINDNKENFKFEISNFQNYYIVTYYYYENDKLLQVSDTIESISDKEVLSTSLQKMLSKNVSLKTYNSDIISYKLFEKYKSNQHVLEIEGKLDLLQNEKNEKTGVISIRFPASCKINMYYLNKDKNLNYCFQYPISLYQKKDSNETFCTNNIEIDSLDISIEQGVIKDIVVRAKVCKMEDKRYSYLVNSKFYFTNKRYIPLRNGEDIDRLSSRDKNFLSCALNKDLIFFIDLADVIDYNRISIPSGTFITKDTTFSLCPSGRFRLNLYKPAISDNFDVRIFSDLIGYNGKSPNGIVQSELQVDFGLKVGSRRCSLRRIYRRTYRNINKQQLFLFSRISPYIKLEKIEKANNQLFVDTTKKGDLLELFKYSHLNVGTDLNIVTYRSCSKHFTLNMAGGVFRTKIGNDSIEQNNLEKSIIYMQPNINLQFIESKNLDFNLKFGLFGAWTVSSLNDSELENVQQSVRNYAFNKSHYWTQFQQSINIHPHGIRDNSIFFRSTQYISQSNNYFSFQIGYSTSLANLFNLNRK